MQHQSQSEELSSIMFVCAASQGHKLTLLQVALLVSLTAPKVHELLMHRIQSRAVQGADSIYQLQEQ